METNTILDEVEKLSRGLDDMRRKLRIAYEYKDDLYSKMAMADRNIQAAQDDYFRALHAANAALAKARAEFDDEIGRRMAAHPIRVTDVK